MLWFKDEPASFPFAKTLRRELSARNLHYADRLRLPICEGWADPPVVCYLPSKDGTRHGNFLPEAYSSILRNENWRKRLQKAHSTAWDVLPRNVQRWRELDSCNSSDALLMNIFCFPGTLKRNGIARLLGVEMRSVPQFGFRPRVPFSTGRYDRTEVDMRLGDLLLEAKLTETGFQSAPAELVESYRDFKQVFDCGMLPRTEDAYMSYQLIRNVLAAHAHQFSFCLMIDQRRPDLHEAWYAVMRCIVVLELRLRCKVVTWQEVARELPRKLRRFLEEKYGIVSPAQALSGLLRSA